MYEVVQVGSCAPRENTRIKLASVAHEPPRITRSAPIDGAVEEFVINFEPAASR